ncbi:MAG: ATP-binding cassette domain-containing protein [Pseudomonadota bacterium]
MTGTDPPSSHPRDPQERQLPRGLAFEGLVVRLRRGDGTPVVAIDDRVGPGEILTVMGPSGSGKSTLLAAVTGTLAPAFSMQGRIRLDGIDVTAVPTHRRGIGLMMQDDVLFPHLSVGANLAFGLSSEIKGRAARSARVQAALTAAGLEGLGDRDPATLSGGQRSRVALMRALLAEPRALLLDEPFSKLDTGLRAQLRLFVFGQIRRAGLPALLVTHDREDAAAAGGRVTSPVESTVTSTGTGSSPIGDGQEGA